MAKHLEQRIIEHLGRRIANFHGRMIAENILGRQIANHLRRWIANFDLQRPIDDFKKTDRRTSGVVDCIFFQMVDRRIAC